MNTYTYFERTAGNDYNNAADFNTINKSLAAIVSSVGTAAPTVALDKKFNQVYVLNTASTATNKVLSANFATSKLNDKLDKASILNTASTATDKALSANFTTDKLSGKLDTTSIINTSSTATDKAFSANYILDNYSTGSGGSGYTASAGIDIVGNAISTKVFQESNESRGNLSIGGDNPSVASGFNKVAYGFEAQKNSSSDQNTSVGRASLKDATGTANAGFGFNSLKNAASYCVGIGNVAGQYETGSYKLYIDSIDRGNEAIGRTNSLVYGEMSATTAAQLFQINGKLGVRIGTTIDDFSTDGTLLSDSDDTLVTEKAIKTYVDNSVVNTFLGLTDTPSSYTSSGALFAVNLTTDGIKAEAIIYKGEGSQGYSLQKAGSGYKLAMLNNLTVEADSYINQDLTTNASPSFIGVTLANTVNEFSTDGTLSGNSDTAVPTEKAVKTYVDNNVVTTFQGLTDTPATYGDAGSIYVVNATANGVDYSNLEFIDTGINKFTLEKNDLIIDFRADFKVEATSVINQDVTTDATPVFAGLNLTNTVTEFSTDGTMSGNSDSAVPTEKAVVSYVAQQFYGDLDNKSYFIDEFIGYQLKAEIWRLTESGTGSNSYLNSDEGGVFELVAGESSGSYAYIKFNVDNYAISKNLDCVFRCLFSGTDFETEVGLSGANSNDAKFGINTTTRKYTTRTRNVTDGYLTADTSVSYVDQAWVKFAIKTDATHVYFYINDVLEATHTTNLPDDVMHPIVYIESRTTAKQYLDTDYVKLITDRI